MNSNFNKIIFLKNFDDSFKPLFFSEKDERNNPTFLSEMNWKWYNIYQSVNTFIWKDRKIKDIAEIKSCFIDIDYPEILEMSEKERASFLNKNFKEIILPKLKFIKQTYNIFPNIINITLKGFHILFDYSEECYFIDINTHLEINNILNDILGGDSNARDIARVYKIVWYKDMKNWIHWKIKDFFSQIIKSSTKNNSAEIQKTFITKDIINHKFWKTFIERDISSKIKEKESNSKKEQIKNKNIEKINNIDALIFLNKLKECFTVNTFLFSKDKDILKIIENKLKFKEEFNCFKFFEADWKNLTSWLMIQNENTWWKINDYSKKTRIGNYNFLKNWILDWIEIDYSSFVKILHSSTGLTLNTTNEKKAQISSKLMWDDHYNRFATLTTEWKDAYQGYLSMKMKNPWFKKLLRGLSTYLFENKDKIMNSENPKIFKFELNDFLRETFWYTTENQIKKHRIYIKSLLLEMASILVPLEKEILENWKKIKQVDYEHFFKLSTQKGWWNSKKEKIILNLLIPEILLFWNPWYINKNILTYQSWFKESKITDLLLEIDTILNNTNHNYTKNISEVYQMLDYKSTEKINRNTLLKHMKLAKERWFFKSYKIENDTLIVSKFNF